MTSATILFVDNDPDFLKTQSEFLEREGYKVLRASTSTEARRILDRGGIDVAILDVRLRNDDDDKDATGLTLAKETDRSLPKVILTNFPSVDGVREALRPQLDGLPTAVEFVSKQEGKDAIIQAIHKALGPDATWLRRVKNAVKGTDDELKRDHDNAQRQSTANYWASLCVAVIGIIIIFVGVILVLQTQIAIGIASAVGGVVTEAISYLFFRRVDTANDRMDRYHRERIDGQRFETLLQACDGLAFERKREYCRNQVIAAAINKWLGVSGETSLTALDDAKDKE